MYENWMQKISFGASKSNSAIASTTSDAAKISIEATLFYTYQINHLPAVILFFTTSDWFGSENSLFKR